MNNSPTVHVFITCLVDALYPEIGEAVVRTLNRAGVLVDFPAGQTCCGQPAFNAGMWQEARQMACHTIEVLEKTDGIIVVPSGSCTAMLVHGYQELFKGEPGWQERAAAVAKRTFELTQFLVDVLGLTNLGASWDGRLAYHSSCHLLRDLGVQAQPLALLAQVEGAEIVSLPGAQECCGFGGVFSVEHPEISGEMLRRKIENLSSLEQAGRLPTLVTCDAGCLSNILGGLVHKGVEGRVCHIAEILAAGGEG